MSRFPFVASLIFNRPLVMRPDTAELFADNFNALITAAAASFAINPEAAAGLHPAKPEIFAGNVARGRFADKKYIVTDAGVGILPVYGPLTQRAGQIGADCTEMTSYQRLARTFDAMMADRDVKAILLEIDSPGGDVAGNFELAATIQGARDVKPVWAHANEYAFSGGYSLLAAADRAQAPQTGMAGSIGVVMMHVDQSAKDQKQGYVYTPIYAGARKVDFNPHAPLSAEAQANAEATVQRLYDVFVNFVASARSLDPQAVRDTEAGIFGANDARQLGLIDATATFADTLAELEQLVTTPGFTHASRPAAEAPPPAKEIVMADNAPAAPQNPATPAAAAVAAPAAPAANAAPAAPAAPAAAAPAAPVANAIDERARIKAIVGSEEAKGREPLANHIAFETAMSVDDAKKMLAASAKDTGGGFAAAMAAVKNPKVGADGEPAAAAASASAAIDVNAIYARRAAAART